MKADTWVKRTKERSMRTLPRRRTGFESGALIPGSVSTMVIVLESDEDHKSATDVAPTFQHVLDSDASSEFDTDLEEEFPGN